MQAGSLSESLNFENVEKKKNRLPYLTRRVALIDRNSERDPQRSR